MLLTRLPQTVVVVTRGPGSEDAYGNPVTGETARTSVSARLWQASTLEATQGRDTAAETWQVILPASTAIDAGDRVEWDGKAFDVQGAPAKVYDATSVHHVEAELRYAGAVT